MNSRAKGKRTEDKYKALLEADGWLVERKPIVRFHETAQGVAPALRVLYYPSDLAGNEFLYPREQAERIAAVSRHPVLAFDDSAARGAAAGVITIEPQTTDAASK